jgi:hypothetical protein
MSDARSFVAPSALGTPNGKKRELERDVRRSTRKFSESQATFGLVAKIQLKLELDC